MLPFFEELLFQIAANIIYSELGENDESPNDVSQLRRCARLCVELVLINKQAVPPVLYTVHALANARQKTLPKILWTDNFRQIINRKGNGGGAMNVPGIDGSQLEARGSVACYTRKL